MKKIPITFNSSLELSDGLDREELLSQFDRVIHNLDKDQSNHVISYEYWTILDSILEDAKYALKKHLSDSIGKDID